MELNQEQNTYEQATVGKVAFCYKCGAKLVEGAAFCSGCGVKQPVVSAPVQVSEQPKPTYAQEPVAPTAAPIASVRREVSTKTPVASIILVAIAILAALIYPIQYKYFTFSTFLTLTAYSAILVSFILHKKNVYFIAGIGCALLMILEMWYLICEIEYIFRLFNFRYLLEFFYPLCYAALALGFFLARTKVNTVFRIVGAFMGLTLDMVYLIWFAGNVFNISSTYAIRTFVVTILEASLFVSALTVRPNTK